MRSPPGISEELHIVRDSLVLHDVKPARISKELHIVRDMRVPHYVKLNCWEFFFISTLHFVPSRTSFFENYYVKKGDGSLVHIVGNMAVPYYVNIENSSMRIRKAL